jgi:hypothetical protein
MGSTVGQVRLDIAYKGITPEGLEFLFSATNVGSRSWEFNPSTIRLRSTWPADCSGPASSWNLPPFDAADRLAGLQAQSDALARESNPYGVSATGDFLVGAIGILGGHKETEADVAARHAKTREEAAQWDKEHQEKIGQTRSRLAWWNSRALLRNSLDSSGSVSGSLLFPFHPKNKGLEMLIPVRDTMVSFPFSQKVVTSDPTEDCSGSGSGP